MNLDLTGVLELGGPRGAFVPVNPCKTLTLPRGSSVTIRFTLLTSPGAPYRFDPLTDALVLSVKRRPFDVPALLALTGVFVPEDGDGRVDFTIAAADWRKLDIANEAGQFLYDIWLSNSGTHDRNAVMPTSPFVVTPSVTDIP